MLFFPLALICQVPQHDCPPRQACANYGNTNNINGFGTQELNAGNRGCLTGNEHNSDWIVLTILTSGTLQFTINPSAAADDMDFAVWGPNPVCPMTGAPMRCSFAASGGGNTGVNSANNAPATDNSENASGNSWVQDMNVIAGEQYVVLVDDFTNNKKYKMTFGGTATLTCSPLPIELISFDASETSGIVNLSWVTASERNNDYFTVERSRDGLNFESLTQINGAGASSSMLNYSFKDMNPLLGTSYYRLKQTDYDGLYSYSEIKSVSIETLESISMFLYPNPSGTDESTQVELSGLPNEQIQINIFDITGKLISTSELVLSGKGNGMTKFKHHFEAGIYIVRAKNNQGHSINQKLVIK